MKNTIFLVLAAATLLLFSGCDAMLEAFYPEYADNYDNNNVLTVEYDLNNSTIDQLIAANYNNQKPILIDIYKNGTGDPTDSFSKDYDSIAVANEGSYWFDFYVSEGSYNIWIWQDSNDSGKLDSGDFVLQDDKNEVPSFFFSGTSGQYEYYYGDQWTMY